jgi:hypothetical protein
MADLTSLNDVQGAELNDAQIHAILAQIDLDIMNLVRDGKLSALKYGVAGPAGQMTDRAANMTALLAARDHYQRLLLARPAWITSQAK